MDVSEILGGSRVRAKAAEARTIAIPLLSPAIRGLELLKRELGREIAVDFGGELIRLEARKMYKHGRQTATRLLFDGCAELVFQARASPEDFIGALDEIQEKVKAELEAAISVHGITGKFSAFDTDEAQLCRLEWERKAWESKPSIVHRIRRHLLKSKPAISRGYATKARETPRTPSAKVEDLTASGSPVAHEVVSTAPSENPSGATALENDSRQRRWEILKRFRTAKELETSADLARHLAMSQSAIQGIVRGDRKRFGEATRRKFLEKIGIKEEDW